MPRASHPASRPPATRGTPFPHFLVVAPRARADALAWGTLLAPFSFTGQPAVSLPLHWTADGLPVGVQLVGRRGDDEVLLRLALDLQEAADWRGRRPVVR